MEGSYSERQPLLIFLVYFLQAFFHILFKTQQLNLVLQKRMLFLETCICDVQLDGTFLLFMVSQKYIKFKLIDTQMEYYSVIVQTFRPNDVAEAQMLSAKRKQPEPQGDMQHGHIYTTFWKRQNYPLENR